MFSPAEQSYYQRQLSLPELGPQGQQKLRDARVLVVGAGGLGCPALTYLAAAGVGTIGIADFDRVEVSNLHRQILFTVADVGRLKAEVAAERLHLLNPYSKMITYLEGLNRGNALDIVGEYDLVVDGSDNFPTRYLVNDACVLLDKPLVFGSIYKFEGQVSVFNYQRGPTYRCLYPTPPNEGEVPNCAEIGVLGVLPGIVGSLQAVEAIKIITGLGEVLSGKILLYDALRASFQTFRFTPRPESRNFTSLQQDYGTTCTLPAVGLEEIEFEALEQILQQLTPPILIDVREPVEFERFNVGGTNWPLRTLSQRLSELQGLTDVILCCQSGVRSRKAYELLSTALPTHRFRHLKGGVGRIELTSL
ncbi:molybdopterin-synthase adenylyltransferase MoeB [Salmonirosea aquatica]|uniref:Molybdopterin-synthase adenylyltransferase n=1 Tax=Salmonirosea aquatica TaxID=2654236 RepID=A0A7C9BGW3_9BACT|nr:molybdopterin-synthase adenylyltransferase MoeB [Cytophagaceae bacterium SJW1-29]